MPRRIVSILVALMMCAVAHASEESTALLKKAKEARAADQQEIALRQVTAAIKQDPNDLEARWFLIGLTLGEIGNYGLPARALPLADISPAINALAEMAKKAKQTAFLHYITASHRPIIRTTNERSQRSIKLLLWNRNPSAFWPPRGE